MLVSLMSSSVPAAIDLPALDSLLGHVQQSHIHLDVPGGRIPKIVTRGEYGTTDQVTIDALDTAKSSEVALADKTAQDVTNSQKDDDLLKKCLAEALRDVLSTAIANQTVGVEGVVSGALEACLKGTFGETPAETLVELAKYLAGQTAERANEANEAAPEPSVFYSWVSRTASSLEGSGEAAAATTTSETTSSTGPGPKGSGSGGSTTTIVVVAAVVVLALFLLARRK